MKEQITSEASDLRSASPWQTRRRDAVPQTDLCPFHKYFVPQARIDERLQRASAPFYKQRLQFAGEEEREDLRHEVVSVVRLDIVQVFGVMLLEKSEHVSRHRSIKKFQRQGQLQPSVNDQPDGVFPIPVSDGQRGIV